MRRARTVALALGLLAALALSRPPARPTQAAPSGTVYVLSNSPAGNAVLAYSRAADGSLSGPVSYPTGGTGTGGGLGSQGSVILDGDDLYAVNAGSNSISRFSVRKGGLELEATVPSGGTMPISLTVHDHLLYVLNGGAPTQHHRLRHRARRPDADPGLDPGDGPGATGPAQISFSRDGHVLVVTEKSTSSIETFYVDNDVPDAAAVFAVDRRHAVRLRLRQARQPARLERDRLRLLVLAQPRGPRERDQRRRADVPGRAVLARHEQGRPLRVHGERGAGTISGFTVGNDGSLTLLTPGGATASLGATLAPARRGDHEGRRYLYNLTDGLHRITGFSIGKDGSLDERRLRRRPPGRRRRHRRELSK